MIFLSQSVGARDGLGGANGALGGGNLAIAGVDTGVGNSTDILTGAGEAIGLVGLILSGKNLARSLKCP